MKPEQWWKTGGLCGALFVVLFIVCVAIQANGPTPDDSAAEIKKYFSDSSDTYLIADIILGIAFVFLFLPYIGMLSTFLGRKETDGAGWARVVQAYGTAMLALGAAVSCLQGALAYDAVNFADDGLLKFAVDATYYANALAFGLIISGMAFTISICIFRTEVFARWLGFLGLAVTILSLIGVFGVFSDDPMGVLGMLGWLGFLGFAVFNLAMSYYMWTSSDVTEPVPVIV